MGTNFYFYTQERKVKTLFEGRWQLIDDPEFGYILHIGKTSAGWLPLFEGYKHGFIKSIKDIKTVYDSGLVRIIDEFKKEYDWDAFVERVLDFNGGTTEKRIKEDISEEYKKTIPPILKDDNMPDWVPVSHFEYGGIKHCPEILSHYYKDPDGYEFCFSEFS